MNFFGEFFCKQIIKKTDVLEGLHPFIKFFVRKIIGKPAIYFVKYVGKIEIITKSNPIEKHEDHMLYECLILNDHPTRFEDGLRRILHKKIK